MRPEGRSLALVVRADATPEVGVGHFMRCLALAEGCVARGGQATFVTRCESAGLLARARDAGVRVEPLTAGSTAEAELQSLRTAVAEPAEGGRTRWVVLDGYGFGPEYQRAVRELGSRTLVVDDTGHHPAYNADVLLNQNLDATGREYAVEPGTVMLLGTRFALLRREFLPWRPAERPVRAAVRRVLVTLGGGDSSNHTLRVMEGIARAGVPMEEVRVLVGPANRHRAELERWAAGSRLPVRLVDGRARVAEHMAWADVAVSAAGSTAWELAFMGVPALLLQVAENQAGVAREMHSHGAALSLGAQADPEAVGVAVASLAADRDARLRMSRRGRELVDGRGVERVLSVLGSLTTGADGYRIVLRRASPADSLDVLRLSNDPGVRANAFNPDPIALEDHVRWYARKLASEGTAIWVIELAGVVAAQVRYDRLDADTAEIGYAVASAFRGMGLGTRILELTWRLACQVLGVSTVYGVVIRGNTASVRAFEKAGFHAAGEKEVHGRGCLAFERRLPHPAGVA